MFLVWKIGIFVISAIGDARFIDNPEIIHDIYNFSAPWNWFIQWDSYLYIKIADQGYLSHDILTAFFPLLPLLIRFFRFITGGLIAPAALLATQIPLFGACYFMVKLFRIDYGEIIARRSLIFMLAFPAAVFLGAVYSEPVFLFFAITSFYAARKGKFLLAGLLGGLLALTRQPGFLIILPLFAEYLLQHDYKIKNFKLNIVSLALIPIGLSSYLFYLWRQFGNPLYFVGVEHATFHRKIVWNVLDTIIHHVPLHGPLIPLVWPSHELIITLIFIAASIYLLRIRLSYGIYSLAMLFPVLISGTLDSMNRYSVIAFPVFLVFANLAKNESFRWLYLLTSLMLLGINIALFTNGMWVG